MTTNHPEMREIVTKAVCGRGSHDYQQSIDLELSLENEAIRVLGNFVSNAMIDEATLIETDAGDKTVEVKGHYDIHVWYSFDQETKAAKTTVTFKEHIPIELYGKGSITNPQVFAAIKQKPRCLKAHVKNSVDTPIIRVEIEQELTAEVIGQTKIKVGVKQQAIAANTLQGIELKPPDCSVEKHPLDCPLDLKCDEDLPDEDEDFDNFHDDDSE
jgi:spore coat protein E